MHDGYCAVEEQEREPVVAAELFVVSLASDALLDDFETRPTRRKGGYKTRNGSTIHHVSNPI